MHKPIRVTVWNEFRHEKTEQVCKDIYPDGMHTAIASYLKQDPHLEVRTATLEEPEHGLTKEVLQSTDVLTWWGHVAHGEVSDDIVERVQERVLEGMGILVLHSGHMSKIFRKLMGTGCQLRWRESSDNERLWVVKPSHPVAAGLGPYIDLPQTEMYGEHFNIPDPDDLVFISWFKGGEVFRSGAAWSRGLGKVFYFSPGHETFPTYHNPEVLKVIGNAVKWLAFKGNDTVTPFYNQNVPPLEKL